MKEFSGIEYAGGYLPISGFSENIKIKDEDSIVRSFYVKEDIVAPFVIEKRLGNGRIIFVNVLGFFNVISDSPNKFFTVLGNIPDLIELDSEKYPKTGLNPQRPRFLGTMEGTGKIMITSSELFLSGNSFYIEPPNQNFLEASKKRSSQNDRTYVKIQDLTIYGPFITIINSTSISHLPSSEYGYIALSLPDRFDMTLKLSNHTSARFTVAENGEHVDVKGGQINFKGVHILPDDPRNVILMRNPEITIEGITTFEQLHSYHPTNPVKSWAEGIPLRIEGTTSLKVLHNDYYASQNRQSITYFNWLNIDGNTNVTESSLKTFEVPLEQIINSEASLKTLGAISLLAGLSMLIILKKR